MRYVSLASLLVALLLMAGFADPAAGGGKKDKDKDKDKDKVVQKK
jgi:hypothetical protein